MGKDPQLTDEALGARGGWEGRHRAHNLSSHTISEPRVKYVGHWEGLLGIVSFAIESFSSPSSLHPLHTLRESPSRARAPPFYWCVKYSCPTLVTSNYLPRETRLSMRGWGKGEWRERRTRGLQRNEAHNYTVDSNFGSILRSWLVASQYRTWVI